MSFLSEHPQLIAEKESDLEKVDVQLLQIEELKKLEPNLIKQKAALETEIADLKSELAFHGQGKAGKVVDSEGWESKPVKKKPAKEAPAAVQAVARVLNNSAIKTLDPAEERKKRMKALNKKLDSIKKLKTQTTPLDADQKQKLAAEAEIVKELAALERGEEYVAPAPAPAPEKTEEKTEETPAEKPKAAEAKSEKAAEPENEDKMLLPTDPAEVEKRLKVLKKKIQQIEALKQKGGNLDAEAQAKLASHRKLIAEVTALERGDSEVVFESEHLENERIMKGLKKKLDQIVKLKKDEKDGMELDDDAKAKLANAEAIKKEYHALEKQVAEVNKKERERVAERLGWSEEVNAKTKKGKPKNQ